MHFADLRLDGADDQGLKDSFDRFHCRFCGRTRSRYNLQMS